MDYSGQDPKGLARSREHAEERRTARTAGMGAASADPSPRARLHLVTGRLLLSASSEGAPSEWQQAFDALIARHQIALQFVPPERMAGLTQMRRWAGGAGSASPAPVFSPWHCFSPVAFQPSGQRLALPRAQWAASYLFDSGVDRPVAARSVDIMLLSPHPDACSLEEDGVSALPRLAVLSAMIRAAREEGRERVAIIVSAPARSAMARRLLGADRALTQGRFELEIVSVEDAIGRMIGGAPGWDAVIALPELRSIVCAALAQTCAVPGPWPLLWHDGGLRLVTSEALGDQPARLPLDATVLIQSLALVARAAGLGHEAQCLHESWARLRDRGVTTPARGSSLPYATTLGDAEFIELALAEPSGQARPVPGWKAISRIAGERGGRSPVGLSLVASR